MSRGRLAATSFYRILAGAKQFALAGVIATLICVGLIPTLGPTTVGAAPVAEAVASSATSAAAYSTTVSHTRWAPFFAVRVTAGVYFSGGRAYASWKQCDVVWSSLLTIETQWCGVYQGTNFIDIGVNYQVHYLYGGIPVSYPEAFRIRVYNDGRTEILRYYY